MKSEDAMKSDDMEATAESVAQTCGDHPDMMVHDAIEQAKMAH
jgi:hypothetical protein